MRGSAESALPSEVEGRIRLRPNAPRPHSPTLAAPPRASRTAAGPVRRSRTVPWPPLREGETWCRSGSFSTAPPGDAPSGTPRTMLRRRFLLLPSKEVPMLDSGMINKIQKARTYATEPTASISRASRWSSTATTGTTRWSSRRDTGAATAATSTATAPAATRDGHGARARRDGPPRGGLRRAPPAAHRPPRSHAAAGFRFGGWVCFYGWVWACPRLRRGRAAAP